MEDWDERKPSVVFVTDDVQRTCDRLATSGVTISQPVVEMAWGKFRAFLDTEGDEFGLEPDGGRVAEDLAAATHNARSGARPLVGEADRTPRPVGR